MALDAPYDHSLFDQFLKKYVNEKGQVDYAAAQKNPELLEKYLEQLRKIDRKDFAEWPREELMALWLNAYHAGLIHQILKYYPIQSVNDIPSFWDMAAIKVGDRSFGLSAIRKDLLINSYRDAKIHFGLSVAANPGPKLLAEAYTGHTAEGQLYLAVKRFVNDSSLNQIKPGAKTIYLSKIFEWHKDDFVLGFGVFENDRNIPRQDFALLSFLAYYLNDDDKIQFLEEGKYKIKYAKFDWSLNDWTPAASPS